MKTSANGNLFLACLILLLLSSPGAEAQDLKDVDGNVYRTAKLGTQIWTASNLNVSRFRNGDKIAEAKTQEEWIKAAETGAPAWCVYENRAENGTQFGKLYNWFAINDPRGLAPEGWHIPENADWQLLVKNLNGVDIAGTKLKSQEVWKTKKGTDNIGFAAIPGGYRNREGKFMEIEKTGQWWSNSVPVDIKPSNKIFTVKLEDSNIEVKYIQVEKGAGYSVRCEKN